jgi:hypothetical protein
MAHYMQQRHEAAPTVVLPDRGSEEDIKIALVRQAYGLPPLWHGAAVVARATVEYGHVKQQKEAKATALLLKVLILVGGV